MRSLEASGIGFRSLTEHIETTAPNGQLIFLLFGALAEFKGELIRERTNAGMAAAKARGREGGRPAKLNPERLWIARRLLKNPESTVSEVARTLGVHSSILHKALSADTIRQSAVGDREKTAALDARGEK